MSTKYINYNTDTIANLNVAQDLGLNDYFLVQPQDFNTKAKILPLKNLVITLDNCTFQSQFNQHTTDIANLSTFVQTVNGSTIQPNTIDTISIKNSAITLDKIAPNSISTSHIINKTIQYEDLSDECISNLHLGISGGDIIDVASKLNTKMDNIDYSAFSNLAMPNYNVYPFYFTGNDYEHRFNVNSTKEILNIKQNFFVKNEPKQLSKLCNRAYNHSENDSTSWWSKHVKPYIVELKYTGVVDNDNACVPGILHIFGLLGSGTIICQIGNTKFHVVHDASYNGSEIGDGVSDGQLCIPYLLSKQMVEQTYITFSNIATSSTFICIQFIPYNQFKTA